MRPWRVVLAILSSFAVACDGDERVDVRTTTTVEQKPTLATLAGVYLAEGLNEPFKGPCQGAQLTLDAGGQYEVFDLKRDPGKQRGHRGKYELMGDSIWFYLPEERPGFVRFVTGHPTEEGINVGFNEEPLHWSAKPFVRKSICDAGAR